MIRTAIVAFFLYVVFEGALRKWALTSYSTQLFLLKDVILGIAFLVYLKPGASTNHTRLRGDDIALWVGWILLTVGYAALEGFSIESLAGLRYYLAPLPLLVLVPALLRDFEDLHRHATRYLVLAAAVALLGVYQYVSPLDSAVNQYAWASADTGAVSGFGIDDDSGLDLAGDRPRITGTFSYISPYAAFLQVVWFIALVLVLQGEGAQRRLAAFGLVIVLFNIAMTGSRAPFLTSVLLAVPFVLMGVSRRTLSLRLVSTLGAILVSLFVVAGDLFEPFGALAERAESAGDADVRISGTLLSPLATFRSMAFTGEGIGSSFGGFGELGHTTRVESTFDEVFSDRVGIELGAVGYMLALAIKLLMAAKALHLTFRARSDAIRYWALAAFCLQVSHVWQVPIYNSVAAIFYFSSIGLVYWLRQEDDKLGAAPAKPVASAR